MTLEYFRNLPFMQEIPLLYPVSEAENIEINNITVLEAPVEDFVRENEIIVSTALNVRNSVDSLREFIYEIYTSGAAALILSFPDDAYSVLYEIMAEFETLNFPIFTSPWAIHFSDILEQTFRAIWAQEAKMQSGAETLQKQLLQCYLENGTYQKAAEIISDFFHCKCLLLDVSKCVKASNFELEQENLEVYLEKHKGDILETAIENSERVYGRLLLIGQKDRKHLAEIQNILKEYCNTVLILWFSKEWAVTAIHMKSHEEFVYKIATGEFSETKELYYKAELMGFSTGCEYICLVGTGFYRSHFQQEKRTVPFFPDTQSSATMIQLELLKAAEEMHRKAMVTYHDQNVIVFLEWTNQQEMHGYVNEFLDRVDAQLEKRVPRLSFAWGYDRQGAVIELLYKRFRNAKEALSICREMLPDIRRKCYQLSIVTKMLTLLEGDKEMMFMIQDKLEPLLEYDRMKQTNLMDTLACYCDTNYNISETARLQHLHRQSLLYRLGKIEQLCSVSLKDHDDLYLLDTCIKVYRNMYAAKEA